MATHKRRAYAYTMDTLLKKLFGTADLGRFVTAKYDPLTEVFTIVMESEKFKDNWTPGTIPRQSLVE